MNKQVVRINTKIDRNFISKSLIIVVLWSTPPLVSKLWVGSGTFPGFYFGFLRYVLGSITLFILIWWNKRLRILKQLLYEHPKSIIFCAGWLTLMIFGQNFSVQYILGSSSSILLNFNPSIIYIFAPMLFFDEKYSRKKTIGFVISSLGIFIVLLSSLEINTYLSITNFILGNFFGFLSGLAWAGYSLSLKKLFLEKNPKEVTSLNLFIASIILFLFSFVTEKFPPFESYSLLSIWGLIIIGIGAAAIAFTLYLSLIQQYGAIYASNIQFLIPLLSLLFAWIFLGEFSIFSIIGGILCAIGVALVSFQMSDKRN
jgi:drug/metabolite transporter (DMT)-like permease